MSGDVALAREVPRLSYRQGVFKKRFFAPVLTLSLLLVLLAGCGCSRQEHPSSTGRATDSNAGESGAVDGDEGILVGRALQGETGSPAPRVRVSAFRAGHRTEYSDSDGSGVFLFPGLTEGEWGLCVEREGDLRPEKTSVTIAAGETTWVILSVKSAIPKHGSISGMVRDEETCHPLPYANVYISELTMEAVTDNDGYYRISSVSPGLRDIEVGSMGYETSVAKGVRVVSGECTLLDFTLRPGIVPSGTRIIPH